MPYENLTSVSRCGWYSPGAFELELRADGFGPFTDEENYMATRLLEKFKQDIELHRAQTSAEGKARRLAVMTELLGLFPEGSAVFVEVGENPYYGEGVYSWLSPELRVTTPVGRIVIHHRKRVISIQWVECRIKIHGSAVVADKSTTHGVDYCHAYGLAEAAECIQRVLAAPLQPLP